MAKHLGQSSGQTVREYLVDFGMELLTLDESKLPEAQKTIDEQRLLDAYEAAINAYIVSVLKQVRRDIDQRGFGVSGVDVVDAAIAAHKQETK